MNPTAYPTCTAFLGHRRVANGSYAEVDRVLSALERGDDGLLVFDDASGALVDHPWPAGWVSARLAPTAEVGAEAPPAPAPGVGRPRLGVVAREVTLLPRHWEWLAQQRGGASAALRRLVDEARRGQGEHDAQRLAKERAYRFMSAIGGSLPGFEEATRALFASDPAAFAGRIAHWPPDLRGHLAWLARDAFGPVAPPAV